MYTIYVYSNHVLYYIPFAQFATYMCMWWMNLISSNTQLLCTYKYMYMYIHTLLHGLNHFAWMERSTCTCIYVYETSYHKNTCRCCSLRLNCHRWSYLTGMWLIKSCGTNQLFLFRSTKPGFYMDIHVHVYTHTCKTYSCARTLYMYVLIVWSMYNCMI